MAAGHSFTPCSMEADWLGMILIDMLDGIELGNRTPPTLSKPASVISHDPYTAGGAWGFGGGCLKLCSILYWVCLPKIHSGEERAKVKHSTDLL